MGKEAFTALLGAGTEFEGKLNFEGAVRIDGKFTGEIVSAGRLIIGKGAHVSGVINVAELVVTGKVEAEMTVTALTLLHHEAEVHGTLSTAKLAMEEGAILQGALTMLGEPSTVAE